MSTREAVLLVEDNADDETLTLRTLRKQHLLLNEVVVVRDGSAALDWLFVRGAYAGRDPALRPRVVLLDWHLPKLSGLQVLREIRGDPRTQTLPVVILMSSKEDRDSLEIETHQLGTNGYVCKPLEFKAFMDEVNKLGIHWLLVNAPG